jgi:N-acyl homoserine lactone hydrolase
VDYGAALEMRFGATRRGFESRPLRQAARTSAAVPTRALPEIVPLEMGEFTFPVGDSLAGQRGVVMSYLVRHSAGILLFDTGFGFGNAELEALYHPRGRRLTDALADAGVAIAEVGAVVNCHLHVDHAGQNSLFAGVPIYVQPAEWEIAHTTDHTILDWIDFPGARYDQVAGDRQLFDGITVIATPGHTPGHQSLVVEEPDGRSILVGQAVYTAGEWAGDEDAWEGRSTAPDQAAYDRSFARLRALHPDRAYFGHDRRPWTAAPTG